MTTAEQFEKAYTVSHYQDVANQAQEDRRTRDSEPNPGRRSGDAGPTSAIIRRTNPDRVTSRHGGEPQWRCTVCRCVYNDQNRARECAVADFAKRDEEANPCA